MKPIAYKLSSKFFFDMLKRHMFRVVEEVQDPGWILILKVTQIIYLKDIQLSVSIPN